MRLFTFIRYAWRLAGRLPWIDEPEWNTEDTNALRQFLGTKSGIKLRLTLLNSVLRQNAHAVSRKKELEFEAGFANGMRSVVHTIEILAKDKPDDEEFTSDLLGAEFRTSKGSNSTTNGYGAPFGRF